MADIFADDYGKKPQQSSARSSGYNESFAVAKAMAAADKMYFGIIPAGVEINGVSLVHDADADGTFSLGFEPVDTTPVAALTQWFSAQALSAAGRKESVSQPVVFNKPVKLVGTLVAGAITSAIKLTVVLAGKHNGVA
jgi:hypothetical protein